MKSCDSGKESRQRLNGTESGSQKASPKGLTRKEQIIITVTWHGTTTTVIAK
ncbi:MAG: hypothetical protein H8D45_11410 [Bacteroidetes bacterium]|nr:hypothetical protein [Bacteroidota bacterium]MBL7104357.1 hypothetical protein [Bacteroidales bacterium]